MQLRFIAHVVALTGVATAVASCGGDAPTVIPPGVAEISIDVPARALVRHDTARVTAVVTDGAGQPLANVPVTFSAETPELVEVTASGLITALAPGAAVVRATAGEVSATATLHISELPDPDPTATDAVIVRESFDAMTTAADLRSASFLQNGAISIVPGRSGNAVRFSYSTASPTNEVEYWFGGWNSPTPVSDVYVKYAYRLSPGADPTCGNRNMSGFKWFMALRTDGPRYTMGVSNLPGGPAEASPQAGLEFTSHDNSSAEQPSPHLQNISKSPRFGTTNDGQWHTYTLHIVTADGGYEQIWVDGMLVLDSRRGAYDHDAAGIAFVRFPGNMVSMPSGCDFTVDVDDFTVWRR